MFDLSQQQLAQEIEKIAQLDLDRTHLAQLWRPRLLRKYDELLDDHLLNECNARDRLDIDGARDFL